MDAKSVAAQVKELWLDDPPAPVSPEEQHEHLFYADVCSELGLRPTRENRDHVGYLMKKAKLEIPKAAEYPKALTVKNKRGQDVAVMDSAGNPVIFADADEEKAYNKSQKKTAKE